MFIDRNTVLSLRRRHLPRRGRSSSAARVQGDHRARPIILAAALVGLALLVAPAGRGLHEPGATAPAANAADRQLADLRAKLEAEKKAPAETMKNAAGAGQDGGDSPSSAARRAAFSDSSRSRPSPRPSRRNSPPA
ncbi:MAG: hypothetical protein MZU95_15965 [Desulfomicrobium escambiense]|nr:hypothetical protein [Desulfomicrobium escambiense]